jgi:hypothetical protein
LILKNRNGNFYFQIMKKEKHTVELFVKKVREKQFRTL